MKSEIKIQGYDLLGEQGQDGIRFAWSHSDRKQLLESAAFSQHRKGITDNICGYTTSVSMGCLLRPMGLACKFCRTGNLLRFSDLLSPFDIAKQNVFMVLADMHCSDKAEYNKTPREFAYMGQGEPGYSYPQIRQAIELTNIVMKQLNQHVFRHIISTAGVPEMIENYKDDVRNKYFSERVTLHFSLHATKYRSIIMPINEKYGYHDVLDSLRGIHSLTGEKPCVSIMLFKNFVSSEGHRPYSNNLSQVKNILEEIPADVFRLSFCEFNESNDIGKAEQFNSNEAEQILDYAINMGYEAKLFSSFGKHELTACGMLSGKTPDNTTSKKWMNLESDAERLIHEAMKIKMNES